MEGEERGPGGPGVVVREGVLGALGALLQVRGGRGGWIGSGAGGESAHNTLARGRGLGARMSPSGPASEGPTPRVGVGCP